MLYLIFFFIYCCVFSLMLGLLPGGFEDRPTLQAFGLEKKDKKRFNFLRGFAMINKPLCIGGLRQRIAKDIAMSQMDITPEEFLLIKEVMVVLMIFAGTTFIDIKTNETLLFVIGFSLAAGYVLPEFWLKGKIKKVKNALIRELPDAIDLMGLCVNAGLDFMLALKWVIEKSPPSVTVNELNILLQEINLGKTRRDAIRALAARYELPDLSTFARTLIQADKMGTSMTEALNILSDDMRISRYRRGEQLALKAPLKMLVPLLLFIFPVVFILVGAPIMLDFMENNPFKSIGGK